MLLSPIFAVTAHFNHSSFFWISLHSERKSRPEFSVLLPEHHNSSPFYLKRTFQFIADMSTFIQQPYPQQPYPVAAAIAPGAGFSNVHASTTHDASCDSCHISPIVGARYRCTVRNDFDLCPTCESTSPQPYPMTKLYSGEQIIPTYYKDCPMICDGCYKQPIIGPIYICTQRDDFGLCVQCEGLHPQPYPMTKVYNTTQAIPICDPARISEIYASVALGVAARRELYRKDDVAAPVKPTRSVVIEQQPQVSYYAPQRPPGSQAGNQQRNQQESVAHKVLNLHPTVQANALKVGGSVLKMFGSMVMKDGNENR